MQRNQNKEYGHGASTPYDQKGGLGVLDLLLLDLMREAETDPNVKGFKLSMHSGKPTTFEVNVNGNIEHATFLSADCSYEDFMRACGIDVTEEDNHEEAES